MGLCSHLFSYNVDDGFAEGEKGKKRKGGGPPSHVASINCWGAMWKRTSRPDLPGRGGEGKKEKKKDVEHASRPPGFPHRNWSSGGEDWTAQQYVGAGKRKRRKKGKKRLSDALLQSGPGSDFKRRTP